MRCLIFAIIVGGPVFAEPNSARCDELWFARNAMNDAAGYCFESPLGQAVFDNSDCTTANPDLGAAARAMSDQIRRNEIELGCSVDTSRKALLPSAVKDTDQRQLLEVQPPVPSEWQAEFSCIGYRGAPVAMRAAPTPDSTVLSTVAPGSIIDFDRLVFVEDGTFDIISQLVVRGSDGNPDDGEFIAGWNGYPEGRYWMFVNIRDHHDASSSMGWAFLQAQAEGQCENVAG